MLPPLMPEQVERVNSEILLPRRDDVFLDVAGDDGVVAEFDVGDPAPNFGFVGRNVYILFIANGNAFLASITLVRPNKKKPKLVHGQAPGSLIVKNISYKSGCDGRSRSDAPRFPEFRKEGRTNPRCVHGDSFATNAAMVYRIPDSTGFFRLPFRSRGPKPDSFDTISSKLFCIDPRLPKSIWLCHS